MTRCVLRCGLRGTGEVLVPAVVAGPVGATHFGQAAALSVTLPLRSVHLTSDMHGSLLKRLTVVQANNKLGCCSVILGVAIERAPFLN